MHVVWTGVLAALLIGYFALEGCTLGAGMLLPVLGRGQEGRDRVVAAIAPYTLAGEVWLVGAAGVLIGAFPAAERQVVGGLYPLMVTLLLGWILRDAGLWFRRRLDGPRWRAGWDAALCLGSAVLAWSVGAALVGTALTAVPPGGPSPAAFAGGLLTAALFALHGRVFLGWRLPGEHGPARSGRRLALSAAVAALPAAACLALTAAPLAAMSAPPATLSLLAFAVLPFTPVLIGAQVWVWRTFGPETRIGDGRTARIPSFF